MRYEDEPNDWQPDFTPENIGPVRMIGMLVLLALGIGCGAVGFLMGANL